jgi:hypothetical protein
VRSLSLCRAAEWQGLLSSGGDGTVRAFGLRGELQGSLPVEAGFTAHTPPPPPPPPPRQPGELPSEEALAAAVQGSARAPLEEADGAAPPVPTLFFWRPALDGDARAAAIAASRDALGAVLAAAAAEARGAAEGVPRPPPEGQGRREEKNGEEAAAEESGGAAAARRRAALQQLSALALHSHETGANPIPATRFLTPREAAAQDIVTLTDAARMGAAESAEEPGGDSAGGALPPQAAQRAVFVAGVAARARAIAASADDFNINREALPPEEEDGDDDAAAGGGGAGDGAAAGGARDARTPAQVAREAALEVTRAVVRSGALRPEATRKRVAGVELVDKEKVALLMGTLARDSRDTPNFFNEVKRSLGKALPSAPPQEPPLSPFLAANLTRLDVLRGRAAPAPSPLRQPVTVATSPLRRATAQKPAAPPTSTSRPSPAEQTRAALLSRYNGLQELVDRAGAQNRGGTLCRNEGMGKKE